MLPLRIRLCGKGALNENRRSKAYRAGNGQEEFSYFIAPCGILERFPLANCGRPHDNVLQRVVPRGRSPVSPMPARSL